MVVVRKVVLSLLLAFSGTFYLSLNMNKHALPCLNSTTVSSMLSDKISLLTTQYCKFIDNKMVEFDVKVKQKCEGK